MLNRVNQDSRSSNIKKTTLHEIKVTIRLKRVLGGNIGIMDFDLKKIESSSFSEQMDFYEIQDKEFRRESFKRGVESRKKNRKVETKFSTNVAVKILKRK